MLLSVKHIVLCRVHGLNKFEHTAPEPLFNSDYNLGPPSEAALDYLLWATESARDLISTPLQLLPLEIQDMILASVSAGTVAAAKVGCLLGLGTPFRWKDGIQHIKLEDAGTSRTESSPVESQLWFGEHGIGIVYTVHEK
jgi:hypothetical protein